VVTGEPVVVMGGGAQSAAAIAGDTSQPVLYVEFRLYVDFRKTVSPPLIWAHGGLQMKVRG
jgi:hypothetical protein